MSLKEELPLVTERTPLHTEEGDGWLYRMEPGKRIELDQFDQWAANDIEDFWDQLRRVSLSPRESERRRRGAEALKARYESIPYYANAAKDDPGYWEKFYDSRVNG